MTWQTLQTRTLLVECLYRRFSGLCQDGNGQIDEDEYVTLMTKKLLGEDDDGSFVQAFAMLDSNKDGYIPAAELRHMLMKEGGCPLSEQEADELLMFADANGDDLIDYKEFLRWLANPRKQDIMDKRTKTLGNIQSEKSQGNALAAQPTR
mmetsp:Transcript_3285/g.4665  ORF Transcript_3285/g.4665 Transcript_3285/m.4665 type:complete len:150 (-) Transcript_3285:63-512(-)